MNQEIQKIEGQEAKEVQVVKNPFNPKTFQAQYSGELFTIPGILSYPQVFSRSNLSGQFQTNFIISKDHDIQYLKDAIEEIGKKSFPGEDKDGKPFWGGADATKYPPIKEDEKNYILSPRSGRRPIVFYQDGTTQITDPSEIYGGAWAQLVVIAGSYLTPENYGVKLYLSKIMKVAEGPRLGKFSFYPDEEQAG